MIANFLVPEELWYQLLQSSNVGGQAGVITVVDILVEVQLLIFFHRLYGLVKDVGLSNQSQEPCVGGGGVVSGGCRKKERGAPKA